MLTKKQRDYQKVLVDKRVNIALHTPEYNKDEILAAIKWFYHLAKLEEPKVVIVKSPKEFSKSFTDSVRANIWVCVKDSVGWEALTCESDYTAWYKYFIGIRAIPPQEKSEEYCGYLKSGVFFAMFFKKEAYVLVRPSYIEQDDRKRLHSTKKMALQWLDGTGDYYLHGIRFEKKWWDKIVNDKLTPQEIFAIDNLEHRRIAYEFMDKSKMKQLKDYKILDEKIDAKGNKMKIISFTIKGIEEPLKYYQCICPTTKREYFIGTDCDTCEQAKAKSFGLDNVKWVEEY